MPDKVKQIITVLQKAGYEAYAVGGCVRDTLLNREPEDWDITTSAKPEQIKRLFRRTVDTGIKHGTVTVLLGKDSFEVTTYRIDGIYEDGRHPKSVAFTESLAEDLKRRDFTINAMAYNDEAGLVDLFGGKSDLDQRIIRCVGKAEERFEEDALRILRAVRFSAQLDYEIEKNTREAIRLFSEKLQLISAERIRTELQKLLLSDHPEKIQDLYDLGITRIVLEEYDNMSKEEREEICRWLVRSERTVNVRLAILLLPLQEGAIQVLKRLKYDRRTMTAVPALIAHAKDEPNITPKNIRHSIVEIGTGLMPDMISVKKAICCQSAEYIADYENMVRTILAAGDCLSLKDLAIGGSDLIRVMKMKPGKEIGDALQYLLEQVLSDPSLNEYDTLLKLLSDRRET